MLRAKVDRLEQERNHLKHDNDRLEAKVRAKVFSMKDHRLPSPLPVSPSSHHRFTLLNRSKYPALAAAQNEFYINWNGRQEEIKPE